MDWAYPLAGLVVGFIVGLTGVGGGSLMTPLLVLLFGVPPATAVGTDLLYASITKAGGAWVHGRSGNVDWTLVGSLALGSVPAALVTVWVLKAMEVNSAHFSAFISGALGIALIMTAVALFFRERLQRFSRRNSAVTTDGRRRAAATILTGAVLGALVTISSVGAGALGVVVLFLLYPRLPTVKIIGSDIAHAVPLTAVAGLGHFYIGTVDFALLGSLLLGSLPGIYLGSHVGNKFPERILRPTLATMLLMIGGRLMW